MEENSTQDVYSAQDVYLVPYSNNGTLDSKFLAKLGHMSPNGSHGWKILFLLFYFLGKCTFTNSTDAIVLFYKMKRNGAL